MLTPIEMATTGAAVLLAATRLLKSSRPLWDLLPDKVRWIEPYLPAAVMAFPEIAMKLSGVKTGLDLTDTIIVGITFLLPGPKSGAHRELEEKHADLQDSYADAQMALDALTDKGRA